MSFGSDTVAYRRRLVHAAREGKTYFVTFCTYQRAEIPCVARDLVLSSCIHDHLKSAFVHCAVVMPDHVHMLITPYSHSTLGVLIAAIKSASAHAINRQLGRHGAVWQQESFDHIVRSDESLTRKADYIAENPVRKGLVRKAEEYPWFWRS